MLPARKPVEIDTRWVFVRSFLLFLLVFELMLWHRLQRWPARIPRHRMLVFLLPRSLLLALAAAGTLTLLVILFVQLLVRPLLNLWLSPRVDPSWGLFHLTASESIVASVAARRRVGWRWTPGSLTRTNRRLWFFPMNGSQEPWFLKLEDVERVLAERPTFAKLAPVRAWPDHLRIQSRSDDDAVFATTDPNAVLGWFDTSVAGKQIALFATSAVRPAGAFDE
jgi:hypothetical protein